jgi:hypothetical protein
MEVLFQIKNYFLTRLAPGKSHKLLLSLIDRHLALNIHKLEPAISAQTLILFYEVLRGTPKELTFATFVFYDKVLIVFYQIRW